MTIEKASEIIRRIMNENDRIDMFIFFQDFFGLDTQVDLEMFAGMCGFAIAWQVKKG